MRNNNSKKPVRCMGKINVKKCKAECCGLVPIPKDVVVKHQNEMRRGSRLLIDEEGMQIWTKDGNCAFLSKSYRCIIYKDRPEVCRLMGSGKSDHPMMKCHFLGQTTEEDIEKAFNHTINRIK